MSGVAQLVGVGFILHAVLDDDDPDEAVLIAPTIVKGGATVGLRGCF